MMLFDISTLYLALGLPFAPDFKGRCRIEGNGLFRYGFGQ